MTVQRLVWAHARKRSLQEILRHGQVLVQFRSHHGRRGADHRIARRISRRAISPDAQSSVEGDYSRIQGVASFETPSGNLEPRLASNKRRSLSRSPVSLSHVLTQTSCEPDTLARGKENERLKKD